MELGVTNEFAYMLVGKTSGANFHLPEPCNPFMMENRKVGPDWVRFPEDILSRLQTEKLKTSSLEEPRKLSTLLLATILQNLWQR